MAETPIPRAPEAEHPPPGASLAARRIRLAVMAPIERFLHIQAASGIILLVMALIALGWANSPWAASYEHLWHAKVGFGVGSFRFERSLHWWINDGLMTIFFFVVGLEIKREMVEGELSELKRASLPIAAAIGGMLVPAGIYLALNSSGPTKAGWGVPMATDIAFAVGILSLLGSRVPAALRILLLALAIIDDIGAILVIAIFYSSDIHVDGGMIVAAGLALCFLQQRMGLRQATHYLPAGVLVWAGMYRLGVHPTIAGVILGLLTPHKIWYGVRGFVAEARRAIEEFEISVADPKQDEEDLKYPLDRIEVARREAVSPVVRLQSNLHTYVAYGIMPLFALANAGVNLSGLSFSDPSSTKVAIGVAVGLLFGKPLGILLAAYIAVKLGLSSLPRGVSWSGVAVVGFVGGIGFTMAIFIAELAFPGSTFLGVAKLAVLIGSALAAVAGLIFGRVVLKELPPELAAVSVKKAESSTEF